MTHPAAMKALSREFEASGAVSISDVQLPVGADPAVGSLTATRADDGAVDLFVTTTVYYNGNASFWRECFAHPIANGQAYFVCGGRTLRDVIDRYESLADVRIDVPVPTLSDFDAVETALEEERATPPDAATIAERLQEQVIGQDEAIERVSERIAMHLRRTAPRRPVSLLFVGSTGVGKTRTAEVLAETLDDETNGGVRYLRIDMNEYSEAHRVSQLLGSPAGYIGYGDGSALVLALSVEQMCVVLFDEIEKAHPRVLLTLMNALDAGTLTTPKGDRLDCRNCIFLFTSNLGAAEIAEAAESGACDDETARGVFVQQGMLPELVGRVTEFVVFRPLAPSAEARITALAIARLADEFGIDLTFIEPGVIVGILSAKRAGAFGARTLDYEVDRQVSPVLAAVEDRQHPYVLAADPLRCMHTDTYETAAAGGAA